MTTELRRARQNRGWTAIHLADLAETTESRVFAVERSRFRPRPDEARRLAAALGADPVEMFPSVFGEGARHD